jgi:hypothetical protein
MWKVETHMDNTIEKAKLVARSCADDHASDSDEVTSPDRLRQHLVI